MALAKQAVNNDPVIIFLWDVFSIINYSINAIEVGRETVEILLGN